MTMHDFATAKYVLKRAVLYLACGMIIWAFACIGIIYTKKEYHYDEKIWELKEYPDIQDKTGYTFPIVKQYPELADVMANDYDLEPRSDPETTDQAMERITRSVKILEAYVREDRVINYDGKGYLYRITPKNGNSIIMLGTCHSAIGFYEGSGVKDTFRRMLVENNIKKVYYEMYSQMDISDGIKGMEQTIQKDIQDMNLESGDLETHAHRNELKRQLAQKPVRSRLDWYLGLFCEWWLPGVFNRFVNCITHTVGEWWSPTRKPILDLTDKAYYAGRPELFLLLESLAVGINDTGRRVSIQRNLHWMDTIESETHQPTAYVVGSSHLTGKYGLLNLCLNKDWKVECLDGWPPVATTDGNEKSWSPRTCPLFRSELKYYVKKYEIAISDEFVTRLPPTVSDNTICWNVLYDKSKHGCHKGPWRKTSSIRALLEQSSISPMRCWFWILIAVVICALILGVIAYLAMKPRKMEVLVHHQHHRRRIHRHRRRMEEP